MGVTTTTQSCLAALAVFSTVASTAAVRTPWKPAPSPLMTRWASDVTPDQQPEYPRPMLVRQGSTWQHLNGMWEIDVNATLADLDNPPFGRSLPGQILVPYVLHS
jgi:hypothetical protein